MPETLQKTAWGVRGGSTRGASHLRTGLPNQDSLGTWCDKTGGRALAVVSDGHGSARHFRSDTGSRLAVEAAMSVLREVSLPIGEAEDEPRVIVVNGNGKVFPNRRRADLIVGCLGGESWF